MRRAAAIDDYQLDRPCATADDPPLLRSSSSRRGGSSNNSGRMKIVKAEAEVDGDNEKENDDG